MATNVDFNADYIIQFFVQASQEIWRTRKVRLPTRIIQVSYVFMYILYI